ncbi:MAG: TerC family protein [Phycisphaerales bacterium]
MLIWPWAIFIVLLAALVALDLGVITRRPREATRTEALLSVFLWIAAAGLSSLAISRLYETNLWGVARELGSAAHHADAWLQFLTAYATELALSIDNVAVLAVIFAHFKLPAALRRRMLLWVVVVCIVLRAVLIVTGAELLRIPWMGLLFAVALFVAAFREFMIPRPDADIGRKLLIRLASALPTTSTDHGQKLIALEKTSTGRSRWVFTPLMMVFAAAAAADVSFALDSLPAVFTVTRDPFIAFTSNALAILALRSLYFVLAPLIGRFRYMKISLSAILMYLAVAMTLHDRLPLPTWVTLVVVLGVLGAGIGASFMHERLAPVEGPDGRPTPLEDVAEAVTVARRNLYRIGILIGGTAVIIVGILIAPLPGPGPTVLIPAGLVILATEFVWAQRLLRVFKEKSLQLAEQGDRVGKSFPKWVLIPIIIAFYGLFALALISTERPPLRLFINATCFGLSFPFIAWVIRTAGMNLGPLNRFIYAKRAVPLSAPAVPTPAAIAPRPQPEPGPPAG